MSRKTFANVVALTAGVLGLAGIPAVQAQAGYVVTEWASGPDIAKSVAISLDNRGRAYLTVVRRRGESELDIRRLQHLVTKDLSLTTVEERRAWYREHFTGQSWLPDRNKDGVKDWRDLTVQKDSALQIEDKDGDGKGETIRTLDEYHTEVTGIVAGILAVDGDVFVAAEPDFFRYVDKNGDGFPEHRELVATGFQIHMGQGGHNMSGVTLGPDGRVYWSLADKGHHLKTKEGKFYHMPNAGGIFRCEMDGSMVERYSTGERNAQELAFDAYGNLFSMDNDGDYPGEKERALYITEGSEHGWRLNWQWLGKQEFIKISGIAAFNPWMAERLFLPNREDHAAYLTPTIGNFGPGPCGFAANPGTALSPALADCFFMTNHKNQVRVLKFKPKGAFFEFTEGPAISGGVSNTGLAIGPDGALYSASYGGDRGSIFRFDVAEADKHPLRADTQRLLASDVKTSDAQELRRWLDHADQRVRMKAQFELARRGPKGGGLEPLQAALTKSTTLLGKLHAIWGIGQLARRDPALLTSLQAAWESGEPEIIAQSAKVSGETTGGSANLPAIRAGLTHESTRVQFFCAIALGNRGDREAAPGLVKLLETGGSTDPYLRHAAVMGLTGAMSAAELAKLSTHQSKAVRLGAVVALRRQRAPEIRTFLGDADELVLLEAARAIHDDDSIPSALLDLSSLLERPGLSNEFLMRRVINAAFRNGSATDIQRLESYLKRGEGSSKLKRTALASVLWWSQPPVLDAVEGSYREHAPRDGKSVDAAVARLKPVIVADNELREVLFNGVSVRKEAKWLEGSMDQFAQLPSALQLRLLDALAQTKSPQFKALVEHVLESPDAKVREKARSYALQAGVPMLDSLLTILNDPRTTGHGMAVKQLAEINDALAKKKFASLVQAYRDGKAAPEWKLELWQAAAAKGINLPETPDRLEFGGDPERGKQHILTHAAAQCIRCHLLGKDGSNLGPDLSTIGKTRTRAQLVSSLLEPNKEITPGYGIVLVKTKDGKDISGVLTKQEDSNWTIKLADNTNENIDPKNIANHTLVSAMPPMAALMSPEEIRDVVSFLAGSK